MRRQRLLLIVSAVVSTTLWAYACGDGTTEPPPPPPDPPRPTTITVSPATTELTALGATGQFSAEVRDQNGQAMAGATVTWASSAAAVATVNASGLVTAVANGTASITATAGSASGSATVTVAQEVSAVAVTPDTATVLEGDTLRLAATATDANGQVVTGVEFAWASGDTAVAVVDASGLVTGVGAGQAQVTATAAGLTGRATLTVVAPVPTTIAVTPDTVLLTAVGQTAQLTAEVRNQAGRVMDGVQVAWSSADPAVAVVGSSGLVTAVGSGAVIVTARSGEASGDALVTVAINADRAALVALYSATDGPNWVDNTNWLTDAPLGVWYGVDADAAGRVVRIDLAGQWDNETQEYISHGLRGELPAELAKLTELTTLRLSGNGLTGPIPSELGNLTELTSLELSYNRLADAIPPELGDLAALTSLDLRRNNLTGPIPPELGNLAALTSLDLQRNNLTGPIPHSFLQLDQLRWFRVDGQDACVPGASAFVAWFQVIVNRGTAAGTYCNAADVAALESLYDRTAGVGWNQSDGWVSDDPLEEWYGVTADSLGHVTELDLQDNGLTGRLSAALGNMPRMSVLRIADNEELTGRLPLSLAGLPLVEFRYSETELCAPADASFQGWLNAITSLESTGVTCGPPSDRDILEIFYDATGGPSWTNDANWLTDAPPGDWFGVVVDGQGRVSELELVYNNLTGRIPTDLGNLVGLNRLDLGGNNLTGPIPPELGNLAQVEWLGLWTNNLTGPIPPELGNLAELKQLLLHENNLTGRIPSELGKLAALHWLFLAQNNLTGAIPPEFGNLSVLWDLDLSSNSLTGRIPAALGNLALLGGLSLTSNDLAGSLPPELGALPQLRALELAHNPGLAGALPQSLTGLDRLQQLLASGTGLCAPVDAAFQAWLDGVHKRRIASCRAGEPPAAYLTQAVQSREFPVPLVAGEKALLRVFPTAREATGEGIPLVRARFYLGGRETHVQDIPGKSDPIPTEVDESSLSRSANAEIAGRVIQPGLEMVIEVDPDNTLDPGLGVAKRIPETGRLAVDVKALPPFDLTLIPFIWAETHDSSIVDLVAAVAADPEHHEMLGQARTVLPIGALAVTAHGPVLSSSNNGVTLHRQTRAIRVMEGGTGYYLGMMSPPITGPALGGRESFSPPYPGTIAHELGHGLSLGHAPCGTMDGLDPSYPYPDGSIGSWGYDFRDGGRLFRPSDRDLMSYCGSGISDYHFNNALRFRLFDDGTAAAAVSASSRSLLLWGGVGADSVPYLEPAFVVDAPAALPDSAGEFRITGRTGGGGQLFSLSFTMPATADGDGSSSFAFAVPVRAGWEGSLATITLSGPGGSVTLDGESDIPMAILRNPRTGQIRGILRDPPPATQEAADAVGARAPGLEVLFSRGIPGAEAWRR